MVESHIERGDKIETERGSYISSRALSAARLRRGCSRPLGHRKQLHWTLDVTFNEDHRACVRHGAKKHGRGSTLRLISCVNAPTKDPSSGAASVLLGIPEYLAEILGATVLTSTRYPA